MDNPVTALWGQTRNLWSATTRQQRLQFIAILVISLATLTALLWFAFRVEFTPAFTNVESVEAGVIKSYLDSKGVPVQILTEPDNQYTIQVPRGQVSSLQLEVNAAGLLVESGSVLPESEGSMFLTDSDREAREKVHKENQLVNAIKTIQGVQNVKVILNIEKTPTTLRPQSAESTASILVVLAPGVTLDEKQVTGIVKMAVTGVPNLVAKNVTLVDQSGTPLYDPESTLGAGASARIADLEEALSQALRRSLTRDLDRIFGAGNSVVTVRVGLNSDSSEETIKTVSGPDPDNPGVGIIIGESHVEWEAYGSAAGDIPGTTSNVPNVGSGVEVDGGQGGMYHSWETNYEINEILQTHQIKPGDIRKVSGTVVLNSRSISVPIDETVLETVAEVAKAGLGVENVRVFTLDFEPLYDLEALEAERALETYRNIAFAVIALLALVALLFFAWRYLVARRRRLAEEEAEMARQLVMQQEVHLPDSQLSVQEKQRMQVMEELNRLALNKPDEFAKLMTAWMEEG